jgi:pilus assembly protein CpaB
MKPARIVVLLIALAAGGIAALLAGRSDRPANIVQAPVAPLETVDVLVASGDIGLGQPISAGDLRWQTWPAAAANNGHFVLRNDKPDAQNQIAGSIARSPFFAGEPIREARLIKGAGSGYMAAILPSGMRAVSTDVTPETGAAVTARLRRPPASRSIPQKPSSPTYACWRSTRPSRRRAASASWSARP